MLTTDTTVTYETGIFFPRETGLSPQGQLRLLLT